MENKPTWISREIPEEKLQSIQVEKDGQKESQFGVVTINGLKFGVGAGNKCVGKGIRGFDISIMATEKPKVIVHCHPRLVLSEVAESLGIEKLLPHQLEDLRSEPLSDKEILRQQLELLAERSRKALTDELPQLTHAMVELYKSIPNTKVVKVEPVTLDGQKIGEAFVRPQGEIMSRETFDELSNSTKEKTSKVNTEVFEGMSFKCPPLSKEDYTQAYEEYVRRCSS